MMLDIYFRRAAEMIDNIELLSLDVFDTLLMRTCRDPSDVFEMAALKVSESIFFPYSPATYRSIRIEAENRARRKRIAAGLTPECGSLEIFEMLPFTPELRTMLQASEFECEKDVLFLSESAVTFLELCKSKGKKIVLTSNMYYSGNEILSLLSSAGFDSGILDGIFVSSDYGLNKSDGKLFSAVKSAFPEIPPQKMLHIGDNEKSDVLGASLAGLLSFEYAAIPRKFGSIYDMEKFYGGGPGELSSLRRLAAASVPKDFGERESFFFRVGAEVIGPVCALFAQWIVNFSVNNNIRCILPLMREGALLATLIQCVIKRQGLNISCEPFYSSRHSLFAASIYTENIEEKVSRALVKSGVMLKTALLDIGLDLRDTKLESLSEKTIGELKATGNLGIIIDFLRTSESERIILTHSEKQRTLLLRYLRAQTNNQRAITVDIGMKGSAERLFKEILEKSAPDIELYSALLMGSDKNNVDNILDGVKIFSWLGFAGENTDAIIRLFYQASIIEVLTSAVCGTVLRYEEKGGEVCPILDGNRSEETRDNITAVTACQQGVAAFQSHWFKLVGEKPQLMGLLGKKRDFINIWRRFVEMPTRDEAINVGALIHYDRYSWDNPFPLCDLKLPVGISDTEIERILSGYKKSDSEWPQAAVSIARPDYFPGLFIKSYSEIPFMGAMYNIAREILDDKKIKTVVIYAASQRGRDFYSVAKLLGIPVKCFTDGNRSLHGRFIDGLEVVPPEALGNEVDSFVVASFLYSEEICRGICEKYAGSVKVPKIFAF